jgi:hypothetical protein
MMLEGTDATAPAWGLEGKGGPEWCLLVSIGSAIASGGMPERHETFPMCPVDPVDVLVGQLDIPYGSGLPLETPDGCISGDARFQGIPSRPELPLDQDRELLIALWAGSPSRIRLLPVGSSPLWIDEDR